MHLGYTGSNSTDMIRRFTFGWESTSIDVMDKGLGMSLLAERRHD
jgi:hypothetical protein